MGVRAECACSLSKQWRDVADGRKSICVGPNDHLEVSPTCMICRSTFCCFAHKFFSGLLASCRGFLILSHCYLHKSCIMSLQTGVQLTLECAAPASHTPLLHQDGDKNVRCFPLCSDQSKVVGNGGVSGFLRIWGIHASRNAGHFAAKYP